MDEKSWEEFLETQLLWWINRSLHLFGWAIVVEKEKATGKVMRVYPARTDRRGFSRDVEEEGFLGLAEYLKEQADELLEEIKE